MKKNEKKNEKYFPKKINSFMKHIVREYFAILIQFFHNHKILKYHSKPFTFSLIHK